MMLLMVTKDNDDTPNVSKVHVISVSLLSSVLDEVHQQLSADLTDKSIALEIDSQCTDLGNTSDTIQLHTDPTRIMKG